jgi:hypothetical protein
LAALAVAGCGGQSKPSGAADRTTAGTPDTGMMGRMNSGGMQMGMKMRGMEMMPMMQSHLDSMMGMSPERMQAMMAGHERMASQMMDAVGADMRQMTMAGDPTWSALSDSVKRDLAELPSLKGQALTTRMRAHLDRMRRLIGIHQGMMKNMARPSGPR